MPPKKRKATDPSPASCPATKKPPAKRSARKKNAGVHDGEDSEPATAKPSVPWPDHFKQLERVHRALNTVYTFLCSRKHLATTFDNLKSAVEAHIKPRLLTITDIAQIKFLVPRSVHFEYVDEDALQIYVAGSSGSKKDDAYTMTSAPETGVQVVLLFEFIDGDLKRSVARKLNEAKAPAFRKPRDEDLKMPTFPADQMLKLIKKRNDKFAAAVDSFLRNCERTAVDPVESIRDQFRPLVPTKSESSGGPTSPEGGDNLLPLEIPKERKSIEEILEEIKATDLYQQQIVKNGHRVFPPQEARFGDLGFVLSQALVDALYTAHNITQLYSHQAEAINNMYAGHHVIVSTPTSSGKSLIYQIPVLHELQRDRSTSAMFIFPTKALAQDQKRSLMEVLGYMKGALGDVRVDTFDGDTPRDTRRSIREEASVIFTNPDMLHLNILPNEELWRTFLKNLKFVVVDELHVYNGLFGTHVAFIMRRLRRICAALGNNNVRFISCSATIANPKAHMRTIFGVNDADIRLTDIDGSPTGRKEFVCWNTPLRDAEDPSSGRGDSIVEAAVVFVQLLLRGARTIAFCRVRNACEMMVRAVTRELRRLGRAEVVERVMAYRGGYTPQDRRAIEREMFEGRLMGVVATNALELGVDIGSLDAVVIVNFPFGISNLRQQSGRAGRRNKDSLSVLIGGSSPVDQHYMSNPHEIFLKPNSELSVDLENMLVREGHIQCAAYEMPIEPSRDQQYFGPDLQEIADSRLSRDENGFYHCHQSFRPYPSKHVAIRDTEDGHFVVVDITGNRNAVLEEIEPSRAIFTIYEGGIFLHQGLTYLVRDFSPTTKLARVEAVNVSWTTSPRDFTDVDPVETELVRSILPSSPCKAFFGKIRITSVIFGFFKLDARKRIVDAVDLDEHPRVIMESRGFWLDIPRATLAVLKLKHINAAGAIHAAEHAVMALLPQGAALKTECKAPEKEFARRQTTRKRPARLVFYDSPAENGGSRKAFEVIDAVLRKAVERVETCACEMGCPECVAGARCKERNAVMSKAGARVVLRWLLGWEVDVDGIPDEGGERGAGIETIVPAVEVAGAA